VIHTITIEHVLGSGHKVVEVAFGVHFGEINACEGATFQSKSVIKIFINSLEF